MKDFGQLVFFRLPLYKYLKYDKLSEPLRQFEVLPAGGNPETSMTLAAKQNQVNSIF